MSTFIMESISSPTGLVDYVLQANPAEQKQLEIRLIADLLLAVTAGVTSPSVLTSVVARLKAASSELDAGNAFQAANLLDALNAEIVAQSAKAIVPLTAAELIRKIDALRALILAT